MTTTTDLQQEILNVTTAIPGVARVYPAAPAAQTILENVVSAITQQPAPLPISVTETDGGIAIALTIGAATNTPAADLCRLVYDTLVDHLRQNPQPVASIRILIANIE